MSEVEGCRKSLAKSQWWSWCGETDMGQTLPALCTECGGTYRLEIDDKGASKLHPAFSRVARGEDDE